MAGRGTSPRRERYHRLTMMHTPSRPDRARARIRRTFTVAVLLGTASAAPILPAHGASSARAHPHASDRATTSDAGVPARWSALRETFRREDPALAESMEFLLAHMPEHDREGLDPALLEENIRLAHAVFDAAPWRDQVPAEIFRDAVLPYASVDEAREPWRSVLHARCAPLVAGCRTPGDAALVLNRELFPRLGVRYSTARARPNQAPSESIESGLASCTGLSILLVNACRAVGVPARIVGIGAWPHKRGNHTWVEIWDDGWRFVGAAEPDPAGLDRGWFIADATRAVPGDPRHAIMAATWRRTGRSFHLPWNPEASFVPGVDVSQRYAGPRTVPEGHGELRVRAWRGGRRVAAMVRIEPVGWQEPAPAGPRRGVARDEAHDLNDMLSFVVPAPSAWSIVADDGVATATHLVGSDGWSGTDLQIDLSLEPTAPTDDDPIVALARGYFEGMAWAQDDAALGTLETRVAADSASARALVWRAFLAARAHGDLERDHQARLVRTADRESPYTVERVGHRPAEGWGLVIALHGGGGAPPEVNDSQWRHMQVYYRAQAEAPGYIYAALRAPNNEWNGFYDHAIVPLVERLIRQLIVCEGVDPDRVFVIGYSHGGYGAFVIGPKQPDRFAAVHASAAAPTDGETRGENLHSLSFSFMVGGRDTAYGRRERCERFAADLRALADAWPGAYPVTFSLLESSGHSGLPDRDLLATLLPQRRPPMPARISWRMTDAVLRTQYWIHAVAPARGGAVDAEILPGNRVRIQARGVPAIALRLDERLIDLAAPLRVSMNGREERTIPIRPSPAVLLRTIAERADPSLSAVVEVVLEVGAAE